MDSCAKLKKLIQTANELLDKRVTADLPEFKTWHASALRFLTNEFGEDSIEVTNFKKTRFQCALFDDEQQRIWCSNGLKATIPTFEELLSDLDEDDENTPKNDSKINNNKVFIVHGHNGELKYKTAELLRKLGIEPIILHDQPNSCRTIIEKIEDFGSEASAAIILFTPDDVGKAVSEDEPKSRGRQNVVFEAGYFMGLLGRSNTILIKSDNSIELPGDLDGIVYSDSANEFMIAKELKSMGFDIDLNKIL
jgi:predicted nucleotide-binding protein